MTWDEAEAAIRLHIETQWALGVYSSIPLVWENEEEALSDYYMAVNIEGTFAEKTIYGSVGKRSSVEGGLIFFHNFSPKLIGKINSIKPVITMTQILELQTIATYIDLEGGNPPSPVDDSGSGILPNQQPDGNYYRVSGSVPFIVRSVV